MSDHTRRNFLRISGAALGGIAVGSQVTAAESTERFIVLSKQGVEYDEPDLQTVLDFTDEAGFAVVEGPESAVENLGVDYTPDTFYELDLPIDQDATPDHTWEADDEPFYPLQWDKQEQNLHDAHRETTGENTRVAIIDSGVAAGHPDLAHAVDEDLSRNFTGDQYGAGGPYAGYHGTHVAGIVAASAENDLGVMGSAPDTEIVDCRVFSPTGAGASFGAILGAMVYSAKIGCDVANLSLGAYPIPRKGLGKLYGKVINSTTSYVRRQGTLLVIAAGNDAADLQHDGNVISLPNEAANVMSISATGPVGYQWGDDGLEEPADTPAVYTNYGTNAIDISAPGGNYDASAIGTGEPWYLDLLFNTIAQPSYDQDGNYQGASYGWGWLAGTSMAAPQVAGAAALVKSADPSLNANQVRSTLRGTASEGTGGKEYHGSGHLDTAAAVEAAAGKGNGKGKGKGKKKNK